MRSTLIKTILVTAIAAAVPIASAQTVRFFDTNNRPIGSFRKGQPVIVQFSNAYSPQFCGVWSTASNGRNNTVLWTGWVRPGQTIRVRATAVRDDITLTGGIYRSPFNLMPLNSIWRNG